MEIVDSMDCWEGDKLVTFRDDDLDDFLPLWFDESEDEEWLEAWRDLPWLET